MHAVRRDNRQFYRIAAVIFVIAALEGDIMVILKLSHKDWYADGGEMMRRQEGGSEEIRSGTLELTSMLTSRPTFRSILLVVIVAYDNCYFKRSTIAVNVFPFRTNV